MKSTDLAAGAFAGLACLTIQINDDPPRSIESAAWSVSEKALRVRTMTGTTWVDPELVVYSPSDCAIRVTVDKDLIFSDRFEGR